MTAPTIFDACQPRDDVREGRVSDADLAADLAAVIRGTAVPDYSDPARFFANTYPTRGLKNLLEAVCRRLQVSDGRSALGLARGPPESDLHGGYGSLLDEQADLGQLLLGGRHARRHHRAIVELPKPRSAELHQLAADLALLERRGIDIAEERPKMGFQHHQDYRDYRRFTAHSWGRAPSVPRTS